MMKGKDLKWLVGMIPDDAYVLIDENSAAEVVAVDSYLTDRCGNEVYNLVLTEGWSITSDAKLETMTLRLRQLIDNYGKEDQR